MMRLVVAQQKKNSVVFARLYRIGVDSVFFDCTTVPDIGRNYIKFNVKFDKYLIKDCFKKVITSKQSNSMF